VSHATLAMIAIPTAAGLLTGTTATAASPRMCAESDRRFGCSCDSWICSRHPSARTFKWPPVASSRVADFKTETITGARTCAATRAAPTVNPAASTIYPTYAPELVPTVVPTATLGTYMTVITAPVTESAAHTTMSAAAKGVMVSAVLLRPTHWSATVPTVRFSATSSSMFATMIPMSTEPLFAQPARKLLTPLTSPTTAPKPAAATMAYCTKGFYDGQYSAACGTTCGSTSDQAATPDAMPAISLTVGSSDTNTGASMINCHPWKQKQPGQHLDQRKVLASLTTTHCPALNGGNSHAAKHYPGPKGGCISDTTCGSIKRGELRGSTSPVTALEAHAKDLAERVYLQQLLGRTAVISAPVLISLQVTVPPAGTQLTAPATEAIQCSASAIIAA